MKKAKLMFTAIGIFAFVGTALAFTARGKDRVYCYDQKSDTCQTIPFETLEGTEFLRFDFCTDNPKGLCTEEVPIYEGS